jgi:hypothetical protein
MQQIEKGECENSLFPSFAVPKIHEMQSGSNTKDT